VSLIPKDLVRQARVPAYIVTGYLAFGSIIDMMVSAWPVRLHELTWRLGFDGLIAGASGSQLLVTLLFLVFAWAASDRVALGFGFAYALIASVSYFCGAGVYILDALQIRAQVDPAQMTRFEIGAGWTFARMAFSALMFAAFAIMAFRAFRGLARAADRGVAAPANNLIIGKTAAPTQAGV
jgi:hypothetical protein